MNEIPNTTTKCYNNNEIVKHFIHMFRFTYWCSYRIVTDTVLWFFNYFLCHFKVCSLSSNHLKLIFPFITSTRKWRWVIDDWCVDKCYLMDWLYAQLLLPLIESELWMNGSMYGSKLATKRVLNSFHLIWMRIGAYHNTILLNHRNR